MKVTAMLLVLLMVIIGALIGGITNSIAIKMLFRPYKAIYFVRRQVPFTPGLIPKRRGELAEQLGNLVVTHLLTADGLKKKLESSLFLTEMTEWLKKEILRVLRSEENMMSLIEKWIGITDGKSKFESKINHWLTGKREDLLNELRPMLVKDVLPSQLSHSVERLIPELATILIEKAKGYFESEEGIERLSNMVDRFLIGRGTLGGMISMFLGNERLVDKIQPEIIKMLNDEGTHELVQVFLQKEWTKLQQSKVEEIEEHLSLQQMFQFVQDKIKVHLPLSYLDRPLHEWTKPYEGQIINEAVPSLVKVVGQAITNELAHLLKKLELEEVVKQQVEQFSVKRLEEIVLSISRRELKLITVLGALLGGFIGLLQGILLIFLR